MSERRHARLAEASGTATISLDGLGNTIDDAEFFPDLPGLVNGVADRLTRLMDLDKRLISALHKACTACHLLLAFCGHCHAVLECIQDQHGPILLNLHVHTPDEVVGLVRELFMLYNRATQAVVLYACTCAHHCMLEDVSGPVWCVHQHLRLHDAQPCSPMLTD